MFYKAGKDLVSIPLSQLTLNKNRTRNNKEAQVITRSEIECHRNYFFLSTVTLWNALPLEINTSVKTDYF